MKKTTNFSSTILTELKKKVDHSNLLKGNLTGLPYELMRHVASYLRVDDSIITCEISRDWYIAIDNEDFHNYIFKRDITTSEDDQSIRKRLYRALQHIFSGGQRNDLMHKLWSASRNGYEKVIERIIKDPHNDIQIDMKLGNRATILETASLREHPHIIALALGLGANPLIGQEDGDSAMHLAVCTNKMRSVVALIDNNCDPNAYPTLLTGPLYSESREYKSVSRLIMVSFLLENGFRRSRNVIDIALGSAIENGRIPITETWQWTNMLEYYLGIPTPP